MAKPADVAAQIQYGNQDEIWKAIRTFKKERFSRNELICRLVKKGITQVNGNTVSNYLTRLVKGEYLKAHKPSTSKKKGFDELSYEVVNDCGNEAPRLRRDGTHSTSGIGNEHMWRAMKILGKFSAKDLSLAASNERVTVMHNTAKGYIRYLTLAGYLSVVKPNKPGSPAVYRLIPSKNTGPLPPKIQRTKRVFDPNLKTIVWSEDDELSSQ